MCMSTKIKTQENTVIVPSKSVYMNSGFTNPLSFIFFVMIWFLLSLMSIFVFIDLQRFWFWWNIFEEQ